MTIVFAAGAVALALWAIVAIYALPLASRAR